MDNIKLYTKKYNFPPKIQNPPPKKQKKFHQK